MGDAGHMSQSEVASEHRGCVSKLSEMAFSKSSLPLLLVPFINSLIMICESMLSASQDGLSREMLLSQYRLQILDYIYIIII
jgi:hypothetical protein